MYKVLIVDDSAVICSTLKRALEKDGRFDVVGTAYDGRDAIRKNELLKPDIITMDINMPMMNGIDATREILKTSKPAIVAITSDNSRNDAFKCIEAGAIEIMKKPTVTDLASEQFKEFCESLALIAGKNKSSRLGKVSSSKLEEDLPELEEVPSASNPTATTAKIANLLKNKPTGNYDILVIGSSTGGPTAVQVVLQGLGKNFPLPILVTQHIDEEFDGQFANWLNDTTDFNVVLAENGVVPKKGNVYIAPAGSHLKMTDNGGGTCSLVLNNDPPMHFLRPAVDKMFSSAAEVFKSNLIAVLLTGMGKDGAAGCADIIKNGGFTIAEDESSCVVFGMPRAAIERGAASIVLPLTDIAKYLKMYVK